MGEMKDRRIALEIARQCAPVLAGVKPSNLLIIEKTELSSVVKTLEGTGVCEKLLWWENGKSVWLIYRKEQIEMLLGQNEIAAFFKTYGYTKLTCINEILGRLKKRYISYLDKRMDFPHEIGLLLGYPMADVEGYIFHKGKNSLLNGYWKVYGDAEAARKIFDVYTQVKQFIVDEIRDGKNFRQILSVC